MKKIICAFLAVLLCVMCMACTADQEDPDETEKPTLSTKEKRELKEYFKTFTENYKTSQDGQTVIVSAPDVSALLETLPDSDSADMLTAEQWRELAEQNPELVKEYELAVESTDEETVFLALWEQICIELFINTVSGMDFDFSDPYERGGN